MKEKVIENSKMERLKGYFNALDDINGGQREYTTVATLVSSKEDVSSDIKLFSRNIHMKNPEVIKRIKYDNCNGIDNFLKILLFPKPFSSLYPPWDNHIVPSEILKQYRNYSIGHIEDSIDSIFSKEGVNIRNSRDVELLLLKNGEQYFITLVVKSKNIKILLFFYRKIFSKDEFFELFDSLIKI